MSLIFVIILYRSCGGYRCERECRWQHSNTSITKNSRPGRSLRARIVAANDFLVSQEGGGLPRHGRWIKSIEEISEQSMTLHSPFPHLHFCAETSCSQDFGAGDVWALVLRRYSQKQRPESSIPDFNKDDIFILDYCLSRSNRSTKMVMQDIYIFLPAMQFY